jgi:hypothetical protein
MTRQITAGVLYWRKNLLERYTQDIVDWLEIEGLNVRFMRYDDARENMLMKNEQDIKSFELKFKFLGPMTHQRNGKVERKFQTFYDRIWSMINQAGLKGDLRNKFWAECVMTITYILNVITTTSNLKIPFELLYGAKPILHDKLKIFGNVGVVNTKDKKLTNHGTMNPWEPLIPRMYLLFCKSVCNEKHRSYLATEHYGNI